MTIQKIIAVIAAITSLTLFGNLVMLPEVFTDTAAQTSTSSTAAKTEQSEKAEETTLSSEITETKEATASSDENEAAEEAAPSNEAPEATTPESAEVVNSQVTEPIVEEPAPAPVVEETVVEAPAVVEETPAPAPVSQWQPNMLQIAGSFIPYSNAGQGSGQAVIDANHGVAATWGGAPVQSGNDGMNSHIIGHNPGAFNVLFSLGIGSVIEVSDASGQVTAYTVQNIVTVDDSAYGLDGADYWDQVTGTGGGERITLQTCINDDLNLIVFAA
ncbi:sortase [Enterococcus sp. 669A]|uniref:Sortase n=1 Tax=Candidatus Enterococcus moelleringii TaxID=2815325 RepID=A0ABS3L4N2_9ENTE|nr:class F sortase [Enterococcus sp. 669A]MBO1304588.1 sortase [Enterococcus sp. 669A]